MFSGLGFSHLLADGSGIGELLRVSHAGLHCLLCHRLLLLGLLFLCQLFFGFDQADDVHAHGTGQPAD